MFKGKIITTEIGKKIMKLRKEEGLTYDQLAERFNINKKTISRFVVAELKRERVRGTF